MYKRTATLGLLALALGAQAQKISGFNQESTDKQLKLEKQFDGTVSASHIGSTLKELSAYPHNLGSPGSKAVAEKILAKFKSYGLDAKLETYQVLMPTPKT